jgi:hypothetical protein
MEEQRTRQPYLRQIARPSEMRENFIIGPVNKIPQPIPPFSESSSARMRRCYLTQAKGKAWDKGRGTSRREAKTRQHRAKTRELWKAGRVASRGTRWRQARAPNQPWRNE